MTTTAEQRKLWLSEAQKGIDGTHQGRSRNKLLAQADKVRRLIDHVEELEPELEKAHELLREAPVSPRNAFNTHWLERVAAYLATEVKP